MSLLEMQPSFDELLLGSVETVFRNPFLTFLIVLAGIISVLRQLGSFHYRGYIVLELRQSQTIPKFKSATVTT